MENYDVCFAWNVREDADFANLLDEACRRKSLRLLQVTPENIREIHQNLFKENLRFRALIDRASDTDDQFTMLEEWAAAHAAYVINKKEFVSRAIDKSAMHSAFIDGGIQTPYTILLPSYHEQPDIPPIELTRLGEKFIIKPAKGGGGEGVIGEARTWNDVLRARQEFPYDTYLLQVLIVATELDGWQAWFRIIACSGEIYPSWWNTKSHEYREVSAEEEERNRLFPLRGITASIANICKLELFSTEIALTADNIFIVVDYVNDQLDLRLQSKNADGIPDGIIRSVTERLVVLVQANAPAV